MEIERLVNKNMLNVHITELFRTINDMYDEVNEQIKDIKELDLENTHTMEIVDEFSVFTAIMKARISKIKDFNVKLIGMVSTLDKQKNM